MLFLKMCRNPSALQTLFFGIYNYNPVHRKHLLLQLLHQRQKTFLRVKCRNDNIYFYRIHILLFHILAGVCLYLLAVLFYLIGRFVLGYVEQQLMELDNVCFQIQRNNT